MPGGVIGPAATGAPLTGTGTSRPAPPGGATAAPPGCCCGPCDMPGGVIGPAATGAPLTATGAGWRAPPGRAPQAHAGCGRLGIPCGLGGAGETGTAVPALEGLR